MFLQPGLSQLLTNCLGILCSSLLSALQPCLLFVGMHNFPRPRANLRAAPGPRLAFAARPGPPPPGFVGRGSYPVPRLPPPAMHGMPPYFPAGYQQMPIPHGWLPPTGSFPLDYAAPYGPRLFAPPSLDGSGEGVDYKAKSHTKSAERITKVSCFTLLVYVIVPDFMTASPVVPLVGRDYCTQLICISRIYRDCHSSKTLGQYLTAVLSFRKNDLASAICQYAIKLTQIKKFELTTTKLIIAVGYT